MEVQQFETTPILGGKCHKIVRELRIDIAKKLCYSNTEAVTKSISQNTVYMGEGLPKCITGGKKVNHYSSVLFQSQWLEMVLENQ